VGAFRHHPEVSRCGVEPAVHRPNDRLEPRHRTSLSRGTRTPERPWVTQRLSFLSPRYRLPVGVLVARGTQRPSTLAGNGGARLSRNPSQCVPVPDAPPATGARGHSPAAAPGGWTHPETDGPLAPAASYRSVSAYQAAIAQLRALHPHLATTIDLVAGFLSLVRQLLACAEPGLMTWTQSAITSGIAEFRPFVDRLYQDLVAVVARLTLPWSQCRILRLKLIRRQMFGRGNFDLLAEAGAACRLTRTARVGSPLITSSPARRVRESQ
jgi:hypothetical protein